jgi:hypothetical protein
MEVSRIGPHLAHVVPMRANIWQVLTDESGAA